jgi:hypothetical protein
MGDDNGGTIKPGEQPIEVVDFTLGEARTGLAIKCETAGQKTLVMVLNLELAEAARPPRRRLPRARTSRPAMTTINFAPTGARRCGD